VPLRIKRMATNKLQFSQPKWREVSGPRGAAQADIWQAVQQVWAWMKARDFAGYEPYDLLNSPRLAGRWARCLPLNVLLLQLGKRFGGLGLRRWLRVPPSKNPKALALVLAGCCDLARCGEEMESEVRALQAELERRRSPGERYYCWGYDWDFVALRGTTLPAYRPNAVATCFVGNALLDAYEMFGDVRAQQMAESAGEFLIRRLNHSVDTPEQICFSYTPADQTRIYNSSAMVAAFLARVAAGKGHRDTAALARRAMQCLVDAQRADGSWAYGAKRSQQWSDNFHTGYIVVALHTYQRFTGDASFAAARQRGYQDFRRSFFLSDGTPKYFRASVHPVDIHSAAQAILTFVAFREEDAEAGAWAIRVARWALAHMRNADGSFYFQRHRLWTDRTPYMRWGQAWMFRALAGLLAAGQ
jgi:hypothetical protein